MPDVARFRELHASGCFVLPNPWDIGSAVFLERLGFKALATTSAGFAFSRGLPDTVRAIPRDLMLAHVRDIAEATPLPVNADFQSGYADGPESLAENVKLCVATGVSGLSIEDASGDDASPLYPRAQAIERVRAARIAIDATGSGVLLTARCEAYLVDHPEPFRTAVDRLAAFAAAGADCLFAPGVRDPKEIRAMVEAVAPKPVNVLVSAPSASLNLASLTALGVRRVSVGAALARVAWGAFMKASQSIAATGTFDALESAARFDDLNAIFHERK
ncbi:MAG TPA: isocitrate lyase/phosphoenolpyruvate mutase family protein [Candidatus Polarisedimenticolaceae bacterium]|nr:isocitrate lyase/phosphoenolpyruvate mutase family protein [Candidatus Polarisedimenticolaceae bacterium]